MEKIAAKWLEKQGCRILEMQYRTKGVEIDLIYEDGDELVFGEVKYRSGDAYGMPSEAVDERKRQHILRGAAIYAQQHHRLEDPIRFDVIELLEQGETLYIRQIPSAF